MGGNVSALTRVGITLTDAQAEMIKYGTEEERASVLAEVLGQNVGGMNEAIADTPEGQYTQLMNDWGDMKETLGMALIPVLQDLVKWIQEVANWFKGLSPDMQKVILVGGLLIALLPTIIGMISGIATILSIFTPATTAAAGATTGFGLSMSGALLPIILIVAAIAAVIAIGVLLYKNWDTVKEKCKECWDWVKEKFQAFDDWLTNVFSTDWSKNFGAFGDVLNGYLANVKNIWDSIKRVFKGIIDFIKNVFKGDWGAAWDSVVEIFSGIWDGIKAACKAPLNVVIGLINGAIGQINKIGFDVPSWIPGFGGKSFRPNIPKLNYLESGGILTQPTMISPNTMAGEKDKGRSSQSEVVIPLDRLESWIMALANRPVAIDGREAMRAFAPYQNEFEEYNNGRFA